MATNGEDHTTKVPPPPGHKMTRRQKVPRPPGHKRSKPALPKGKVPEKGKRVSSPPKGVLLLSFWTKGIQLRNFCYFVSATNG